MLEYIDNNKQWIFSGIGVLAISLILTFLIWWFRRRRQNVASQRQKSGGHSVNVQTHGDVTIDGPIQTGNSGETESKER